MFSRKNYDTATINAFEIIGSFFVDIIYNSLYLKAQKTVTTSSLMDRSASITDVYRANIHYYIEGITNDRSIYSVVVKRLHAYFCNATTGMLADLAQFENRIVLLFIPKEYHNDLTNQIKDQVLYEVITQLVVDLGIFTIKTMINDIIDDHNNRTNIAALQNTAVQFLLTIREKYMQQFISQITKSKQPQVEAETFEKVKQCLSSETKRRCDLMVDIQRAKNIIDQLCNKIQTLTDDRVKCERELYELRQEVDTLQINNRNLQRLYERSKATITTPAIVLTTNTMAQPLYQRVASPIMPTATITEITLEDEDDVNKKLSEADSFYTEIINDSGTDRPNSNLKPSSSIEHSAVTKSKGNIILPSVSVNPQSTNSKSITHKPILRKSSRETQPKSTIETKPNADLVRGGLMAPLRGGADLPSRDGTLEKGLGEGSSGLHSTPTTDSSWSCADGLFTPQSNISDPWD